MATFKSEFNNGDLLKHTITGYTGVCQCVDFWQTGCVRYTLQAKELHEGKPIGRQCFDEMELELVESAPEKEKRDPTGGPHPVPKQHSR